MKLRRTVPLFLLLGTMGGTGCLVADRGYGYRDGWQERRWERRDDRRNWRDYRQQRRWWWSDRDRYRDRDDD
jgi:hypothetical protein